MGDRDWMDDGDLESGLRREGDAWRSLRTACPDPDLLMARRSEALDPPLRARLDEHVSTCEHCARLDRDLEATLSPGADDDGAASRVLARVAPRRPARVAPWLGLAAGVILAAGLTALWWSRSVPAHAPSIPQTVEVAPAPAAPTIVEAPPVVALWMIEPAAVRVPLSALGTPRGGESAADEGTAALIQALEPYQQGDYAAAAGRLEAFVGQHPDHPEAVLYLGVSYLMADRPARAAAPLERARALARPDRRPEVDWYLATAEQRMGRTEASLARLRELCAGRSRYRTLACAAENALE